MMFSFKVKRKGETYHPLRASLCNPPISSTNSGKDLFRVKDEIERKLKQDDRKTSGVKTTKRFRVVAYSDAAFAVDELKQSVSGWVVYLNGTPILFGSLRQSVVVDSSCSAEYVAASICVKQIMELENMLEFLECTRTVWLVKTLRAAIQG
jgi:hypothetical protein